MSFEVFKNIIDKIPTCVRIDFSGYAEPFMNKECSKMVEYAKSKSYNVSIFTTLIGTEKSDIDTIVNVPYAQRLNPLAIHLPDAHGYFGAPITEKYIENFKYYMSVARERGLTATEYFMTMSPTGTLHTDLLKIVPTGKVPFEFSLMSRAKNLDVTKFSLEELTELKLRKNFSRPTGKIRCTGMPNLDHNVVLPNGDVYLCCMDYGLKHRIGNLLTDRYEELQSSEEMQRIRNNMNTETPKDNLICRDCEFSEVQ